MSEPINGSGELPDSWPLTGADDLRDDLLAAYDDSTRGYHDQQHLGEVLERLVELSDEGTDFDWEAVLLAAWFHDSVYDGERDAEERSAVWAEEALPPLVAPETVTEVARLVRMTETHEPEEQDANGSALSDADLAILAAGPSRYREYVEQVRREFSHIDDDLFAAGRAAVLRDLLRKETLFATDYGKKNWEAAARDNAEAELAGLVIELDAAFASADPISRAG